MSKINWKTVKEFEDITYKKCDGVARIAFNRPDVRNAFRPHTTKELIDSLGNKLSEEVISLPLHMHLTDEDIQKVIEVVKKAISR